MTLHTGKAGHFERETGVAQNADQQIIKIVRNAAGEYSQAFEPGCFAKALFAAFLASRRGGPVRSRRSRARSHPATLPVRLAPRVEDHVEVCRFLGRLPITETQDSFPKLRYGKRGRGYPDGQRWPVPAALGATAAHDLPVAGEPRHERVHQFEDMVGTPVDVDDCGCLREYGMSRSPGKACLKEEPLALPSARRRSPISRKISTTPASSPSGWRIGAAVVDLEFRAVARNQNRMVRQTCDRPLTPQHFFSTELSTGARVSDSR